MLESCARTLHALPLLRPGPEPDERLLGCLGRAAEYYDVDVYGFGLASNHVHLLYGARQGLQSSRFQCHFNGNVARELGRLHGFREKLWGRRYRAMHVGDDRASQRERLKYVLSQPVKDALVEKVAQWPGPSAARALLHGEPLVGHWFNRTKEYYARRKGLAFDKYDFATRYEIELRRLPAYADDTPEEYQAMIAELVLEIEEEGAAERKGRKVLGVEKILAQDPCQPLSSGSGAPAAGKKSPAPMLFFSKVPGERDQRLHEYEDYVDDYTLAAGRMVEAADRGYALDALLEPSSRLPDGSVSSAVVESLLRSTAGFNPGKEFPDRSFPRAWPYVGGKLPPPPPDPPSRELLVELVDDKPTIVWRGEIPTVVVPRRPPQSVARRRTPPHVPKENQRAPAFPARASP